MSKEYYVSCNDSDFFVHRPNGGLLTRAGNKDNAKYICAELNRLLHRIHAREEDEMELFPPATLEDAIKITGRAPKYDPCREFRKGDKVRMVEWHGRSFFDGGCHPNCNKWTVTEDETSGVSLEQDGYPIADVPACFLELITPVEELEPYFVMELKGGYGVYNTRFQPETEACHYWNEMHPHAKEAAEAECERLNAEYRKEMEK